MQTDTTPTPTPAAPDHRPAAGQACCDTTLLERCCEPADKPACCGPAPSPRTSCGCQPADAGRR